MSCGPSEAVVTIDRFGPVNGCQRETIRSSDRLLTGASISNAFWPSGPCDGMHLRHSGWADSQQEVHGCLPGVILGGESVPRAVMLPITAQLPRKRPKRSYSKVPLALPEERAKAQPDQTRRAHHATRRSPGEQHHQYQPLRPQNDEGCRSSGLVSEIAISVRSR